MSHLSRSALAVCLLLESLAPSAARAGADRAESIRQSLAGGQRDARIWWFSWMAIYGVSGVVQTVQYFPERDRGMKVLDVTEAAKSFVGLAALFLPPFSPAYAGDSLGDALAGAGGDAARAEILADTWLNRAADQEEFGTSLLQHVGGVAVNAVGFGVEWKIAVMEMRRDDLRPWIIANALVGLAAGEAAIWTQPTRAVRDRQRYGQSGSSGVRPRRMYSVMIVPGGVSASVRF